MATVPLPGAGDFPSNAHTQNKKAVVPERPKIEKIVTGTVTEKKKGIWKRIGESFTGDDARTVGNFVVMDVIVPSAKSLISDALTTAVERFFFGDGRSGRSSTPYRGSSFGPYTSYNKVGSSTSSPPWDTRPQRPQMSPRAQATHDFREILVETRAEAGMVLDTLTQMVDMYEVATVADFYDAVGLTSEFTDRNWGWTDLREAQIVRDRSNGYLIQLPPPSPLK